MTSFVKVNEPYIHTLGLSINLSNFLFTTLWCYWGIQVWENPRTFGIPEGREKCYASTDTIFVVFGHIVPATNGGLRVFALVIFALGGVSAISSFWTCNKWLYEYASKGPRAAKLAAALGSDKEITLKSHHITYRRGRLSRFGGLAALVYMVITTEQIVAMNPDVTSQVQDWTFSQVLTLILIGRQLLDSISYFHDLAKRASRGSPKSGMDDDVRFTPPV
ncbi:transmembrane protein, putative [Rhizoctonia solani AG-3 Rhs1AP]|uniref:Transmembrane protein, putative n=1 Tax=Rhizoctonia solani AG-3 Rhs1AP TaxID=1086054 RepID=X8J505_9AGAM|nr:transmembrane protein, putative [Rhizoctonia solani AG-3 Rhs1AP]